MTDVPPTDPAPDSASRRPQDWRTREAYRFPGALLDPSRDALPGEDVHPTFYVPDELLVTPEDGTLSGDLIDRLGEIAPAFGWSITEAPLRAPDDRFADAPRRLPTVARTVVARIAVSPDGDPGRPLLRPDAWRLLRAIRRAGIPGVSLNHVMTVDAFASNPFIGNPFIGNPFIGNPFIGNPFIGNGGTAGYGVPGLGGRQPIAYAGPEPVQTSADAAAGGRRPVVAVFDTGCGTHGWLSPSVVIDPLGRYGTAIGDVDPASDPEAATSLGDPLDGVMDPASGHGTFIAGIIVQACPDVEILPVRVSDSHGVIVEAHLIDALGVLVALLERGERIDVLNLSFGYYHESPDDAPDEGELYSLLRRVRKQECVVVCSAGNDATDRPSSPASLHAYSGGPIDPASEAGLAPQVVVGALNPSGRSVAMFSNIGDWVDAYAVGVSVVSTMPTSFDAGAQADLRDDLYGRRRETLDVDDFGSGFAVWSGTSFAAPRLAGRIAAHVAPALMAGPKAAAAPLDLAGSVTAVIAALAAEDSSRIAHGDGAPF